MHSWKTGRRTTLRWVGRIAVAVVLIAVLSAGLLYWRLSRGPVSLNWLAPRLEQALSQVVAPNSISFTDVVVVWKRWSDPLDIRLVDVALTAPDHRGIAGFDSLDVDLRASSLLRGKVVLQAVSLKGLHIEAIRDPDGAISFGLAAGKKTSTGPKVDGSAWLQAGSTRRRRDRCGASTGSGSAMRRWCWRTRPWARVGAPTASNSISSARQRGSTPS